MHHTPPPADTHLWNVIWLVWITATVGSFLALEIYGLTTGAYRTLSAAVWRLEDLKPGEPISGWTFAHVIFIGLLALLFVWLLGHFAEGWWR